MGPEAVNAGQRTVLWSDGSTSAMTNLIDADGDETNDTDEAVVVVAQAPDGGWHSILLSDFEPVKVN